MQLKFEPHAAGIALELVSKMARWICVRIRQHAFCKVFSAPDPLSGFSEPCPCFKMILKHAPSDEDCD